jgi:hypothetical protein
LLNYDLAKEKGIVLSLLQSHISQFNKDASPHSIWCEILVEVQNFNQNALFLTLLAQNLARFTFVIKSATSDAWRACSNRPLTPSVSVVLIGPVIKARYCFITSAIPYFTIQ